MEKTSKEYWYWKFRDRLDETPYYKNREKIKELLEENNNILNGVILEFAKIHATQELGSEDKPERGQALGSGSGNESGLS